MKREFLLYYNLLIMIQVIISVLCLAVNNPTQTNSLDPHSPTLQY